MSLSERAILTHLTISVWSGTVGRSPDDTNNLYPDRDRIIHSIVPRHMLSEIAGHGRQLRRRHYQQTAPWDDNGLRLVPSQLLLEYTNDMRKWRSEFDAIIASRLPQLQQAIEPKYQDRFKDLASRFGTRLTFYPVPDGGKMPLMVDTVDAAVRASIVDSMTADTERRTDQIADGLLQAIKTSIVRIIELRDSRSLTPQDSLWDKIEPIVDRLVLPLSLLVGLDPKYSHLQQATINHEWNRSLDIIRTYRNGQD